MVMSQTEQATLEKIQDLDYGSIVNGALAALSLNV